MDGVDGLKRSHHDAELDQLALVIALEDIDAVDVLAVDGTFEFQHGLIARENLFRVTESAGIGSIRISRARLGGRLASEGIACGIQVELGKLTALLGGVDHR